VTEVSTADGADIAEIARLAAASLPQPWPLRLFEQEFRLPEARLWVAREGARSVGYLAARRIADEVHVLSVAVDPVRRRRGVAGALLEVRASNLAGRAFYANAGFVAVGSRPRYYADGEDALLMTRSS